MNNRKAVRISILLVALAGSYGLFQARNLIRGPVLTIENPAPGKTVESTLFTVTGSAANVSQVRLNGQPIFIDESGTFNEPFLTPRGYSALELSAEDRFGRSVEKRIEFMGKPGDEVGGMRLRARHLRAAGSSTFSGIR